MYTSPFILQEWLIVYFDLVFNVLVNKIVFFLPDLLL